MDNYKTELKLKEIKMSLLPVICYLRGTRENSKINPDWAEENEMFYELHKAYRQINELIEYFKDDSENHN